MKRRLRLPEDHSSTAIYQANASVDDVLDREINKHEFRHMFKVILEVQRTNMYKHMHSKHVPVVRKK